MSGGSVAARGVAARGVGIAAGAGTIGGAVFFVLGQLDLGAGLLAVAAFTGWITASPSWISTGARVCGRASGRIAMAAGLAGGAILAAMLLDWAWAGVQGGVLGPLDYIGERYGPAALAGRRRRGPPRGAARPLSSGQPARAGAGALQRALTPGPPSRKAVISAGASPGGGHGAMRAWVRRRGGRLLRDRHDPRRRGGPRPGAAGAPGRGGSGAGRRFPSRSRRPSGHRGPRPSPGPPRCRRSRPRNGIRWRSTASRLMRRAAVFCDATSRT